MFSVSESIMMANRKWLKAGPRWRPTSDAKGSLVPAAHLITASHRWYMPSPVWCTSLAPLVYHARYQFRCYCLNWSPFFEWSHITQYLPDSTGPWCLGTHVFRKLTLPLHSKDGAITDGRGITMQPRINVAVMTQSALEVQEDGQLPNTSITLH